MANSSVVCYQSCTVNSLVRLVVAEHAALSITGQDLMKLASKDMTVLKTKIDSLDSALGGGVVGGEVVDVCGDAGAGKTRLCVRLAAVQAAAGKRVLYMDTAASLTPQSLVEELNSIDAHADESTLRLISVYQPSDVWDVITTLTNTTDIHTLMVIDAATTFMLQAAASAQGVGALNQLSTAMRHVASRTGAAVLTVTPKIHQSAMARMWQHTPHLRLQLAWNTQQQVTAFKIVKSTRLQTSPDYTNFQ